MVPLKNSIATRLLKIVFSVYLCVTISVTLIHMVVEYEHTRRQVIIELQHIESIFHPALSRALWEMNIKQVRSALLGLEQLQSVIGFQVYDNKGNTIAMAGRVIMPDGKGILVEKNGTIISEKDPIGLFWHEFTVSYLRVDQKFDVGKVRIYSSQSVVFEKLALGFFFLIVNAVIKTIALLGIILFVFQKILIRPLSDLTNATREVNLDNLEDVIINVNTSPDNELKVLEKAFNDMVGNLLRARLRLSEYMRQEKEKLEILVKERTHELALSEAKHRRSEAEMEALFASMTDIILVINQEGRYLKIAPSSPDLLYKPSKDLINKTLHDVFPKAEADRFLEVIRASISQQTTVSIEYDMVINQKRIWFDGRVSPISNERAIFVARDITERRQWELELEDARYVAETANLAKTQFLANMSHELRTPLNAIIGFSNILWRSKNLNSDEKKSIKIIRNGGEHLLALINEVLELSKIEAGRIDLNEKDFNLYQMIVSIREMFEKKLKNMEIIFSINYMDNLPRKIRTDETKLRQILINLVGNAMKFTQQGSITLNVTGNTYPGDNESSFAICFEIIDTGIGIEPSEQEHIFNAFAQAENIHSSSSGTGLGLTICRKYIQFLSGEITVESEVGKGSIFRFQIPVLKSKTTQSKPAGHNLLVDPAHSARILIVDDNASHCQVLYQLLEPLGFELKIASNGKEAVETANQWGPHLIWMDMRMPVMDGFEATTQIKASPQGKDTAIIAVTASAFEEDRSKVIKHGCSDFVRKPFKEQEIFEMLHKHLGDLDIYRKADEELMLKEKMSDRDLAAAIKGLHLETVTKLKNATELSDANRIDEVIEEIKAENKQLAMALSGLTEDYAYDEILALLQSVEE